MGGIHDVYTCRYRVNQGKLRYKSCSIVSLQWEISLLCTLTNDVASSITQTFKTEDTHSTLEYLSDYGTKRTPRTCSLFQSGKGPPNSSTSRLCNTSCSLDTSLLTVNSSSRLMSFPTSPCQNMTRMLSFAHSKSLAASYLSSYLIKRLRQMCTVAII